LLRQNDWIRTSNDQLNKDDDTDLQRCNVQEEMAQVVRSDTVIDPWAMTGFLLVSTNADWIKGLILIMFCHTSSTTLAMPTA
jgi:hypothetical protein